MIAQSEAKRFFVEKVLQQADTEGIVLSVSERHMLSWSESDPDFTPDYKLADQLQRQMSDEDYEAKISGLLKRGYTRDVGSDSGMKAIYKAAYSALSQGDHYILVMIDQALGLKVKRWWPF